MMGFFTPLVVATYFWEPTDVTWTMAKYAVGEVLFLFYSAFALVLVWCLFTPRWVERMAASNTRKIKFAAVVLVVGLVAALLVQEYLDCF